IDKSKHMMDIPDKLTPAMEDYLETIYSLCKENKVARVGEIATKMDVKKSSVNAALKFLSNKNLVLHEKYGFVVLTKEGVIMASEIQDKHDILFRFLTEFLFIEKNLANKEACNIEHSVSKQTMQKLAKFFKFIEESSDQLKPKLLNTFDIYLKTGKIIKKKNENQEKKKSK
ncbi:MAG: metal-dependent transcriptional regulator, partial [Oligoflexia bacterium]|nr:metal-dependent transcriptional regulator [Oligoflexia bacterium]